MAVAPAVALHATAVAAKAEAGRIAAAIKAKANFFMNIS
jgi:hypothetical protein